MATPRATGIHQGGSRQITAVAPLWEAARATDQRVAATRAQAKPAPKTVG